MKVVLGRGAALSAVLVGLTATGAWAASLTTTSGQLGAAHVSLAHCDPTPARWQYGSWTYTPAGLVTGVTVTGLDAACDGAAAKITLTGSTGGVLASGSATVTGGSFSATFAAPDQPGLEAVAHAYVVIEGS